jgi:hypothetical protein
LLNWIFTFLLIIIWRCRGRKIHRRFYICRTLMGSSTRNIASACKFSKVAEFLHLIKCSISWPKITNASGRIYRVERSSFYFYLYFLFAFIWSVGSLNFVCLLTIVTNNTSARLKILIVLSFGWWNSLLLLLFLIRFIPLIKGEGCWTFPIDVDIYVEIQIRCIVADKWIKWVCTWT